MFISEGLSGLSPTTLATLVLLAAPSVGQVLHNGCEADQQLELTNAGDFDHMGQSIAVGGDFNGDGSATVFSPGSPTPEVPILFFYGEEGRDHMGRAVASANLFGSSAFHEIILSGLAWTPEGAVAPHTEFGKGYVWDGDTVFQQ